ncbi:MAG: methyltransferase type 11 [Bacillota bacterium]|nr:MAG: methyltransferase type 11 [Bacillota bacterium]MBS3949316.1 class I SAM-dependent methyltransferase [Peptococcaceae bacterium]
MENHERPRKRETFDWIAPIYSLFYAYQKRHYSSILDKMEKAVGLSAYKTIVDIGCGTGALCSVLTQRGFVVTGVDSAIKMLNVGAGKSENAAVKFVQASALETLPFADKSFDACIASYVAHGLKAHERKILYAEMNRITKHLVIMHDYNEHRSTLTDVVEWLERGDYFNFIRVAKSEAEENFADVWVIDVSLRAAWYIGVPIPH